MSLLLAIFQAVVTQMHVPIGFVNKGMTSYCNIILLCFKQSGSKFQRIQKLAYVNHCLWLGYQVTNFFISFMRKENNF